MQWYSWVVRSQRMEYYSIGTCQAVYIFSWFVGLKKYQYNTRMFRRCWTVCHIFTAKTIHYKNVEESVFTFLYSIRIKREPRPAAGLPNGQGKQHYIDTDAKNCGVYRWSLFLVLWMSPCTGSEVNSSEYVHNPLDDDSACWCFPASGYTQRYSSDPWAKHKSSRACSSQY